MLALDCRAPFEVNLTDKLCRKIAICKMTSCASLRSSIFACRTCCIPRSCTRDARRLALKITLALDI